MKHNIYIVGMGPGAEEQMTGQAIAALEAVSYTHLTLPTIRLV